MYIRTGSSSTSSRESSSSSGSARFGALDFGMVNDLDVEAAELGVKRVQILRCQTLGQHVIDVVVGDMAVFMGQVQESLNRFGQIDRRWRGAQRTRRLASVSVLARRGWQSWPRHCAADEQRYLRDRQLLPK